MFCCTNGNPCWNCSLRNLLVTCSCTKSWLGFHPPNRLLEGHTDRRQTLAQGEIEGEPASAARAVTDKIGVVSNPLTVLSVFFAAPEHVQLFICFSSFVLLKLN